MPTLKIDPFDGLPPRRGVERNEASSVVKPNSSSSTTTVSSAQRKLNSLVPSEGHPTRPLSGGAVPTVPEPPQQRGPGPGAVRSPDCRRLSFSAAADDQPFTYAAACVPVRRARAHFTSPLHQPTSPAHFSNSLHQAIAGAHCLYP
eukprot:363429-Chlamydomonas_euryale.AAC.15